MRVVSVEVDRVTPLNALAEVLKTVPLDEGPDADGRGWHNDSDYRALARACLRAIGAGIILEPSTLEVLIRSVPTRRCDDCLGATHTFCEEPVANEGSITSAILRAFREAGK
mgnify:CR=1 FL=1